ncbi:MAG TPA: RNA-binding transcriptional accessory protein, partial [Afipia sp.]|nr:RNA-binding transcriptional accessory protein [Afipia sp.]
MAKTISQQIADELGVREAQVEATIKLLDEGSTVPFIARYRKEVTGALDDAQLRTLDERLTYLREMEARRTTILNSIREQGKLDAALEAAIMAADSKGRLEDIYLPFKPK